MIIAQQQNIDSIEIANQKMDTTVAVQNTIIYGIKNLEAMPIRSSPNEHVKIIPQIEQLFEPQVRAISVAGWQTILLVLAVILLGLAKAFSTRRFKETYKSLYNYRVAQAICDEEKVFFHRVNVLLTINYLLVMSLFVYQLKERLNYINHETTSGLFFLIVFGFLFLLFIIKLLFAQLLSFIFNTTQLISDYVFTITLFNNLLGVLFILVLSIMYFTSLEFSSALTYFAIPIIAISFLFRLIRLTILGNLKSISYFYIFLYICSLEILPLIVLIKIFILE